MAPVTLLKFLPVIIEGGTEGQVVNLVDGLDPARFAVRLACFKRVDGFMPSIETRAIPLAEYAIKRFYDVQALTAQWRLANDIRRHRVDIVHSYNFYGNVFAIPAARLARRPVIVASIRSMDEMCTRLQRGFQREVCRLADCVLTNADAIRRSLIAQRYDPRRIEVIPNGIDVARFRRPPPGGERFRQEFGLPHDAPIVGVLARLGPIKGIEYFLEAVVGLAARFPQARFTVVGGGTFVRDRNGVRDYRRELEALARRLGLEGRVVFTGVRHDVPAVLSQLAVSVLPSLSEGLSNAVLESMAAGVPVVATRIGGIPEAVLDGDTGLLVPPRDAGALGTAIARLLEDRGLAARLAASGQDWVTQHFGIERAVRRTEQLYARLLDARADTPWRGLPCRRLSLVSARRV